MKLTSPISFLATTPATTPERMPLSEIDKCTMFLVSRSFRLLKSLSFISTFKSRRYKDRRGIGKGLVEHNLRRAIYVWNSRLQVRRKRGERFVNKVQLSLL